MDNLAENPIQGAERELTESEKAVKALKEGFEIFEADIPSDKLTPIQKSELEEAKRKLADLENGGSGTDDVELRDERGKLIKPQKEGVPVYEMMQYLTAKHESLPYDSEEAQKLRDINAQLIKRKYTRDYLDWPYRNKPRYKAARVTIEINRVQTDGRAEGVEFDNLVREKLKKLRQEGSLTRDQVTNFKLAKEAVINDLAQDALGKRREFIYKPEKVEPPVEREDPRFTISIVNADDDANKLATEGGAEYVREKLHVKNKWNPLEWMRYAKFRVGERYFKYEKFREIQVEQIPTGHTFLEIDSVTGAVKEINNGREQFNSQMKSTAERFTIAAEGGPDTYHQEEREALANTEISGRINNLITRYAKGELTPEQFKTEQDAVIAALKADPNTAPFLKDANFVATDILVVAEKLKLSHERGEPGLDNLDQKLNIQIGRAKMAANSEADFNRIEQIMNWTKEGRFRGWAANPLFIGIAMGAAGAGARSILGSASRAVTGFPLAGILGASAFAALEKWATLKADKELQERDATYNKIEDLDHSPRRKKLEEFRYNIAEGGGRVSAEGLKQELINFASIDNPTDTQMDQFLKKIAEVNARTNYGIDNKIDLMTFQSRATEAERLELVKAQRVLLDKIKGIRSEQIKALDNTKTKEQIDSEVNTEIEGKLTADTGEFWNSFNVTKEEQDKNFNKYRVLESAKAGGTAAITGFIGGAIGQEIFAVVGRHFGIGVGPTVIEQGLNAVGIKVDTGPRFNLAGLQEVFQKPTNIKLGNGLELAVDYKTHGDRMTLPGGVEVPAGQPRPGWPDLRDDVRNVTFIDTSTGKTIDTRPFYLRSDGALIGAGEPQNFNQLDSRVQDLLRSWDKNGLARSNENNWFNLKDDLKEMFTTPRNDSFVSAHNLAVEVKGANPDGTKLVHMILHPELPQGAPNRFEFNLTGSVDSSGVPHLRLDDVGLTAAAKDALSSQLTSDGFAGSYITNPQGNYFDILPSNATVFMPPEGLPGGPDAPPFIPTPGSRRNPLEDPQRREPAPINPGTAPATQRVELTAPLTGPQERQPAAFTPLEARFAKVVGPVERNHRFFVDNPPEKIDIPAAELPQFESRLPFFENVRLNAGMLSATTNRNVVPWAWELGKDQGSNNQRFVNGEASTDDDSGLLGVTAASAETPAKQAILYKALADAILRVHEANPNLLKEWLRAQGTDNNQNPSSINIFKNNDITRWNRNKQLQELVVFFDTNATYSESATLGSWSVRPQVLRTALETNNLNADHLRWIEFLSHSVDVPKLIERIKASQPLTPTPPPTNPTNPPPPTNPTGPLTPLDATAEIPATKSPQELNRAITAESNKIAEMARNGEIRVTDDFESADKFVWQGIRSGPNLVTDVSEDLWRGYAMVEPEDFPQALEIILGLARKRVVEGKPTDLKWLKMTLPTWRTVQERVGYRANPANLGTYPQLAGTEPRIVFYGDTQDQIKELLTELAKDPRWKRIEDNRRSKFGNKLELTPRRPGTSSYTDESDPNNQVEWKSLNIGNVVGYSEWEASDPMWRSRAAGTNTVPNPNPTPVPTTPAPTPPEPAPPTPAPPPAPRPRQRRR